MDNDFFREICVQGVHQLLDAQMDPLFLLFALMQV